MLPVLILPGLVVIAFLLPVIIPVVAVLEARDRRRRRAAAGRAACGRCGAPLGEAALDRADEAWAAHVAALMREHPGAHFRLVRRIHAVCPACGAPHAYDPAGQRFDVADQEGPGVLPGVSG